MLFQGAGHPGRTLESLPEDGESQCQARQRYQPRPLVPEGAGASLNDSRCEQSEELDGDEVSGVSAERVQPGGAGPAR